MSGGLSGVPMTGELIASHAEAAADWLRAAGWDPSFMACRGLGDALAHAVRTDPEQRFTTDTRYALRRIFELLIRALTGAPAADYEAWDQHPARPAEEVFGLLAAAAVFARTYGPAQAAAA
ncbi:hypothetical protein [Streptomyces cyaneofuscatus]|uniref:DUF6197 family protein n=1 Tax=Streptomyces cyaneofuscatus TaxID=66883 RepID=UPI00365E4026